VVKDSTLTIKPGVVVKGNYLSGSGQGLFGSVRLVVAGTLQAAGTPDSPIAFTALVPERGWGGILLQGPESNLENVVIERANVAVEIASGASASIRDTLLEGVTLANVRSAAGVRATQDVVATFERAVVKGFEAGLHLQNAQQLVVQDSVVRNNSTGVLVEGRDPAGSGQLNIRSDGTAYISMSCYQPPQQPARWRDPVFVHTDIVDNTVYGIHVGGSDVLLQVERCNVINNKGVGVLVNGRAMHPESYIRQSNIHGNGRWQLASAHVAGLLDISWNYWAQISDPELSSSWSFLCAPHPFTFTGFSPVSIAEAGPRLEVLTQSVAQQTWQQQQ
jgi:hypothetical protein